MQARHPGRILKSTSKQNAPTILVPYDSIRSTVLRSYRTQTPPTVDQGIAQLVPEKPAPARLSGFHPDF